MSYAELVGLKKNVSDEEIIKMLNQGKEFMIGEVVIRKKGLSQKGVSGDFGEPTPE